MEIPSWIRIGVNNGLPILPTTLDSATIALTSEWAGSYHVRAMGWQFYDYVEFRFRSPLAPRPGFPSSPTYRQLTRKLSAPSVTANVGEAVAAEWAVQTGLATS